MVILPDHAKWLLFSTLQPTVGVLPNSVTVSFASIIMGVLALVLA